MSEMDDITRQTGATFRDVLNVAAQWLRTLKASGNAPKALSRRQKRELGEHIMAQVDAQRVAAAWYTKRVGDYRSERAQARHRHATDPFYTDQDAAVDTERLHAMRWRIEETLQNSPLAAEHRGQVVLALDTAERRPERGNPTVPEVFPKMDADAAREARAAAVESDRWVAANHAEMERMAAALRPQDPPRPQRDHTPAPANSSASNVEQEMADRREAARTNAVQAIRHSQDAWLQEKAHGQTPSAATERRRRAAAEQATAAGLSVDEVRWEFAHAETNSRCRVTVATSAPDGAHQAFRSYHPSEAEAAQWTNEFVPSNQWKAGTVFTINARESGRRHPFYLAEGNQVEISQSVGEWHRDTRPDQSQPPDQDRNRGDRPAASEPDPERRVAVLQRALDAVTKDRDDTKQRLESVDAELQTLKNTHLATNQELRTLREQFVLARDERDRYLGERDEAVRKLAHGTPERDRYGSRERVQAEQGNGTGDAPPTTDRARAQRSR